MPAPRPTYRADVVRDLAGRVGPIIGSASACLDIARPRIDSIVEKFTAVIRESASNDTERGDLTRLLDRSVADGRVAVTAGRTDCRTAGRQLADLEQSLGAPAVPATVVPAATPVAATAVAVATAPVAVAAPPVPTTALPGGASAA